MRRKTEVPHNQYLQQRRRTWYVRVAVPPSLVPTVGKTHIVRSLKTRDVVVARERRWEAVADIRRWLQTQNKAPVDPVARGIEDRDWWLSQDDKVPGPDTRHTDRDTAKLIITDIAEEIEAKQSREAALTYFKIATSADPVLREVERRWLEEVSGEVAGQTLGNHRFALDLLHKHSASLLFVGQVDRRAAGRFIAEAVRPGRKPATVNRIISSLSSFWRWMRSRGLTDSNPWEGQGVKRPKAKPKRPYEAHELLRLLRAAPASIVGKRYGHAIQDLLRLGLMTGARLDELCELRAEDVDLKQHHLDTAG